MMKYVQIKEIVSQEGETLYKVNAILLQSKDGGKQKKIPHPLGTETMLFKSLDKAKEAILLSGFEFMLPDGSLNSPDPKEEFKLETYDKKVLDALMAQTKSNNPNIVAVAIQAMSGIAHPDCLKLYISKLGEENDIIRQNSIEAILKYGVKAIPQVVEAMKNENWITRNSAVICLQSFCEMPDVEVSSIIDVLLERLKESNPIVKCSIIKALGNAYKAYKAPKKVNPKN